MALKILTQKRVFQTYGIVGCWGQKLILFHHSDTPSFVLLLFLNKILILLRFTATRMYYNITMLNHNFIIKRSSYTEILYRDRVAFSSSWISDMRSGLDLFLGTRVASGVSIHMYTQRDLFFYPDSITLYNHPSCIHVWNGFWSRHPCSP